uniref:Glycoside hydrolase 131 catalytic N-terminal domain-containing protein n=1 Tax=Peronospora matthiolae TaxID=2874970 RepID=A0AAV1U6R9_9STRA
MLQPSRVQAAGDQKLPWDGRFQDLKVGSLNDKYLTHILTDRQNGKVKPDQWVTITPTGRSKAFNKDTGVATLAVDSEAIFGGQTNFRRSELVQNVAGNTAGTTFFRVSLMKEKPYANKYSWQVVFPESHLFEIRIDAKKDPVELLWYTGGGMETRWSTEFKTKTWYNFGIAVSTGKLALYFSEDDDPLALTKTESYNGAVPTNYEFHFGQLTLSNDGSVVKMVDGQDVLSFNGVSVEDSVPSDAGGAAKTTNSSSSSSSGSAPSKTPEVAVDEYAVAKTAPTTDASVTGETDEEESQVDEKPTDAVPTASFASLASDGSTDKNPADESADDGKLESDTSDEYTPVAAPTTTGALTATKSGCKVRRG